MHQCWLLSSRKLDTMVYLKKGQLALVIALARESGFARLQVLHLDGWMDGCAPVSITFINPILTLLLLGWQKCEKPSDCSTSPMTPLPLNFCWG